MVKATWNDSCSVWVVAVDPPEVVVAPELSVVLRTVRRAPLRLVCFSVTAELSVDDDLPVLATPLLPRSEIAELCPLEVRVLICLTRYDVPSGMVYG